MVWIVRALVLMPIFVDFYCGFTCPFCMMILWWISSLILVAYWNSLSRSKPFYLSASNGF